MSMIRLGIKAAQALTAQSGPKEIPKIESPESESLGLGQADKVSLGQSGADAGLMDPNKMKQLCHGHGPIGSAKVTSGDVSITRDGREIPLNAGDHLCESDLVHTGKNSAVGMTFDDQSRMSLGPNSDLKLEKYTYQAPDRLNGFDARLRNGSLTAASGEIAKSRPLAMRVLMPTTVFGVKG